VPFVPEWGGQGSWVSGGVRVRRGQQFFILMLQAHVNRVDYHILSIRMYVPMLS
jgi:hypothetical protein